MKKILLIVFMSVLLLNGCSHSPASIVDYGEDKLKVYTSFYPIYDFASKIGGDRIELINMVPAGIEPHDWEPGPQKIAGLLQADAFFYNGLGLEPWVNKIVGSLESQALFVVNTSDGIQPLYGCLHDHCGHNESHDHNHNHGHDSKHHELPDPHIWLDPNLALHQAELILNAFKELDSDYADYYQENYEEFREQIEELDMAYSDAFKDSERRKFIVTHFSFAYLAERYGLEQIGISGLSPHSEPSPGQLKEIVDVARQHKIKYIFQEPLTDTRFAEVLAAEIGASVLTLNPMEGLTEQEQNAGIDYFSIMYDNLNQLKKALTE